MAQYNEGPTKTFKAAGAIAQYLRVKPSGTAGQVSVAGLADLDIGVADREAFAAGDHISVRLGNASGTCLMVAAGEIAAHAKVYTAANGQVSATGATTSFLRGIALEAAGAAGDVIEVMPISATVAEQ